MTKQQRERNLKLAEALESKEYKQGKGQLRDGNKFCCLGVACDVYHKETGKGKWVEESKNGDAGFKVGSAFHTGLPPVAVKKWFGWPIYIDLPMDHDVNLPQSLFPTTQEHSLGAASLNDAGATFKKIAKGFRALAAE